MANDIKINDSLCRTCLKTVSNTYNIFENHKIDKLLSEILAELIHLKIQENDGFPTNVCDTCIAKLHVVYDFKTMALESHAKLQHIYANSNFIEEIKDDLTNVEINAIEIPIKNANIDVLSDIGQNLEGNDPEVFFENPTQKCNVEEDLEMSKEEVQSFSDFIDVSVYEVIKNTLTREEKIEARLLCKICDENVSYLYYFSKHLPLHLGKLPFECSICYKRFKVHWELRKHLKILHRVDGPLKCEITSEMF